VKGLRQLLDLKRLQPLNSQEFHHHPRIFTRYKLFDGEEVDRDIDKAKPDGGEMQVEVSEARIGPSADWVSFLGTNGHQLRTQPERNETTHAGGTPSTNSADHFKPNCATSMEARTPYLPKPDGKRPYSMIRTTKMTQNPEIAIDGQTAKLKVGDRSYPRAVFLPAGGRRQGVSVGGIRHLVNPKFTYAVMLDVTIDHDRLAASKSRSQPEIKVEVSLA